MSELFEWNDIYSVGNKTIDEQHKVFISILNRAHRAFLENKSIPEIEKILEELTRYAEYHFETEEKLFSSTNPGTAAHKTEHENFVKELEVLKSVKDSKPNIAVIRLTTFVHRWLANHIMKTDKGYFQKMK